ncbi:hypothetical protein C8F01DRAFT_1230956 [Mycena amicta]|nr:hypothetical protein C8F01DRAFT_1230956 [Mycena amicta]
MMASSPAKRKRSDSDVDAGLLLFASTTVVHSSVWFEDGNLIIQAAETRFRVYRGVLTLHSAVLKERVDELSSSSLHIDVCPVLVVSDSPTDVEHVLKKIFFSSYADSEPIPFEDIASFARLGRAWRIKAPFDNALMRLRCAFPSSFDGITLSTRFQHILRPAGLQLVLDTISLAHELQIPILLPATYLHISPPHMLAHAVAHIPQVATVTVLSSHSSLRQARAIHLFGWLSEAPRCEQVHACSWNKIVTRLALWDPNGGLYEWRCSKELAEGLCLKCATDAQTRYMAGSQNFWSLLPEIFGLPPWADLEAHSDYKSQGVHNPPEASSN